MNLVSRHCCYGRKAAKDMEITKIIPSSALHVSIYTHQKIIFTFYFLNKAPSVVDIYSITQYKQFTLRLNIEISKWPVRFHHIFSPTSILY